jgi:hypothetical protein
MEKLPDTIGARCGVGGDKDCGVRPRETVTYGKIPVSGRVQALPFKGTDPRQGRGILLEAEKEAVEVIPLALHLDDDTVGRVVHPAREAQFGGQTVHEGTETDPLDDAVYRYAKPFNH